MKKNSVSRARVKRTLSLVDARKSFRFKEKAFRYIDDVGVSIKIGWKCIYDVERITKRQNVMKPIFISILFLFFSTCLFAQGQDTIPEEFNYFKIKEKQEKRLSDRERADTIKDDDFEKFMRWDYFWKNRTGRFGDLRTYSDQMFENTFGKSRTQNNCEDNCNNCCFPSGWQYLGPETVTQNMGKVTAIWVNPGDQNHILAGAEGGLWKTIDGGATWEVITDFCLPGIGISYIAVQPNNPDIIYISTAYGNGASFTDHSYGYGVFKTTDGGATWQNLFVGIGSSTHKKPSLKVLIHPVNYSTVYALVGHEVYKSIDSGLTWQVIFGSVQNLGELLLYDIELQIVGTLDDVYVSSYDGHASYGCSGTPPLGTYCWGCTYETRYTAKVWKFVSPQNSASASSFLDLTDPISPILPNYNPVTKLVSLSFTSNSLNIACQSNSDACTSNPSEIKLYKKVGSGPWINTNTFNSNPFGNRVNYGFGFPFEVSPANDNIIYYGGLILNKSQNNGTSFSSMWPYWSFFTNPIYAGSHPDVRFLTIYSSTPTGNDVLFLGTDGGISKTTDGGNSTLNLNGKGIELTQFYGIGNSEILPNLIYGGTQDNGIFDNKNQSWRVYPYGDFYDVVVDKVNPSIAYTTMNSNIIRKTTNGGSSWSWLGCPSGESCAGEKPMYINNNNQFFFAGKNLWRRSGTSWVNITNLSGNGQITGLDMSDNGNIAYISKYGPNYSSSSNTTFSGKVYKITNLNTTPIVSDITSGLEGVRWQGITDLTTDKDGDVVWVSMGNFWESEKKVFKYNAGSWLEYGQGLPNIPATDITHFKGSNGLLFLGMDDGVYYRDNGVSEWKEFKCGLPRTIITDLEINHNLNRLRAATYSRGIWETCIPFNQDNISCTTNPSLEARVFPNSSSYFPVSNNQITSVNERNASVTVKVGNTCQGGGCCGNGESISWRVFRDGVLYSTGSGSHISFSGRFQIRIFGWWVIRRYNYRVEIITSCGGKKCGAIDLHFNG